MFSTQSTFVVSGTALGLSITIEVNLAAEDTDASPLPALGQNTLVIDTQNVETVLLSALNGALMQLQHMDMKTGGLSIENLRAGRVSSSPAQPVTEPYNPEKDGKLQ